MGALVGIQAAILDVDGGQLAPNLHWAALSVVAPPPPYV